MKNLVFISLPKIETTFPPGALAVLSSVAEAHGYEVRIFDFNIELHDALTEEQWNNLEAWCMFSKNTLDAELEYRVEKILLNGLKSVIDSHTRFVIFSVFSYFSNRIATQTLTWYKNNFSLPTVVGGSGVSTDTSATDREIFGEMLIREYMADYVIFGEGELALASLLQGRTDFPGINKNNPQQIEDLSSLPLPTYRHFDMSRYQTPKLLITGSRGCVRKCTFCDIELTWPKFKYRKAEHIIDEIKKHFYEYGITQFEFTDSLINGSVTNFDRFNELLYEEKQKHPDLEPLRYQGQFICRPQNQQRPHSYELMHLAGCTMLIVGIESFSNKIRNHMKKKFSDADIDYHLEQCASWGLRNIFLMIVGYPTETFVDHQHTLTTLQRYKKYADMGTIFMIRWGLTMHLYEHTPIMGMMEELGIGLQNNVKFDSLYGWTSISNPDNTLRERIRRRLELHELCVKLGYPMPRVREELLSLRELAARSREFPQQTIIPLVQCQ